MFQIIEKDITKLSTIRTPSFAKYFTVVNNVDDIRKSIEFQKTNNLKFKILGNGSNILFSKEYYDDILFLKLGDEFKKIKFYKDYVEIGGRYSLIQAGRSLIKKGYSDFIFFNLIPATIGGAVRQNAGTGKGEEIKDVIVSVLVYDIKECRSIELSLNQLNFSYRDSIVKKYPERYIVLSAKFHLSTVARDIKQLSDEMSLRVKEKTNREPKGYCFGSTFMNDEKYAWQYIDSVSNELKIYKNTHFSKKHKNWIINIHGSGQDVLHLIREAQEKVFEKFKVDLKEEVDII
jgi:UDP-N-acetylmuramate dehydrogenase